MNSYHTSSRYYRLWLFWVGIVATVAYRIIIFLNNVGLAAVKIAWYIGTIGFVWYFAHRYRVQRYQGKLIREKELDKKVCENRLSGDDCAALQYILGSLESTKAEWNYIAIFVFSALALVYGLVTDLGLL